MCWSVPRPTGADRRHRRGRSGRCWLRTRWRGQRPEACRSGVRGGRTGLLPRGATWPCRGRRVCWENPSTCETITTSAASSGCPPSHVDCQASAEAEPEQRHPPRIDHRQRQGERHGGGQVPTLAGAHRRSDEARRRWCPNGAGRRPASAAHAKRRPGLAARRGRRWSRRTRARRPRPDRERLSRRVATATHGT